MATLRLTSWTWRLRLLYRQLRRQLLQIDRRQVVVRPLRQEDVSLLDRRGTAEIDHSYADEWRAQCAGGTTMLVAWYGARPLAVGLVHWSGPRQPAMRAAHPDCPEIFRLHVHRLYRSMGLGTLLIDAFERLARERGLRQIGLGVTYANPQAFALYQRLGYGEPALSDFIDEFDVQEPDGRKVHHAEPAHFLVKTLTD